MQLSRGGVRDLASLDSWETGGVLDNIRCELIDKVVSGETPVGFFFLLFQNGFVLEGKRKRSRRRTVEGRQGSVTSSPVSTKMDICT